MSFTPPPAGPAAAPDIPNRRTDAQPVFDTKSDTYLNWQSAFRTWLAGFVTWASTILGELTTALASVESNKNAAQVAAASAETSAANAASAAGAGMWVAGNYTKGDPAWSPTSLLTYRRITVGTTYSGADPANDAAGWRLMGSPVSMPQSTLSTAGPHVLSVGVHYIITHPLADCSMPAGAVAQEMVRVTNRSGATTPILRRNGSTFGGIADDLVLDFPLDKAFTQTAALGWI